MERHADTVWRVCMLHFSERQDAQDAFQNTFLKYALADGARFENEEHRKAWLVRTASNACKDILRASARRSLDDPPRTPLYLSVYEGYTAPEIADLLEAPVNTVYTWISRGKAALRGLLR